MHMMGNLGHMHMIGNLGHMHMIGNLRHMHMIGNLIHMHPIWKSCTHGLLTSIWFVQMISNRLLICTKTSDNNPIICVLATCRQAILTSASPRSRLLVCRWLGHRLLDRCLRFLHRLYQSTHCDLLWHSSHVNFRFRGVEVVKRLFVMSSIAPFISLSSS